MRPMSAVSGKMAAWRAALAVGARAPLRGRLLGPRPARSQRHPPGWRIAAAAALLGGGSVAACYGGWGRPGTGGFLTVLAQVSGRSRSRRGAGPRSSRAPREGSGARGRLCRARGAASGGAGRGEGPWAAAVGSDRGCGHRAAGRVGGYFAGADPGPASLMSTWPLSAADFRLSAARVPGRPDGGELVVSSRSLCEVWAVLSCPVCWKCLLSPRLASLRAL